MGLLNFEGLPLWINGAVFALAAGIVWFAGTRLSGYANRISAQTGLGKAFVGLILLGGITSLPEVATSTTASASGNAALAVNNLLGGVAMQVAVLAIADVAIGRTALTSVIADPIILLQGVLNVVLLSLVLGGITAGEASLAGVGVWTAGVLIVYLLAVWLLANRQDRLGWVADHARQRAEQESRRGDRSNGSERGAGGHQPDETPLKVTLVKTAVAALVILVAGYLLTRTGEAIATKTGLGASFVGAVLVALSTSLPEVSTVLSAVRLRQYEMAVSDIFGTNLFDIVLIFLVDAVYLGNPVLEEVGRFSAFGALLGIAVTALYVIGLLERRDRTVLRLGLDSLAVLGTYIGGVAILYSLR